MPAFQDMEDDDGPEFEYLEEPDFDDEEDDRIGAEIEQEPPDEALAAGLGRTGEAGGDGGGKNQSMRNGVPAGSPAAAASTIGVVQASPPPVTPRPRPKIVSARVQREKLREEEEREGEGQRRKRAREDGCSGGGRGSGGTGAGAGGVADIEGDFGGGGRTSAERSSGGLLEFPRRKRGRSTNHLGDRGNQ